MGIEPVFVLRKDMPPDEGKRFDTLELCLAAERVSGADTVLGAQEIRGLWRIYPLTSQARVELLLNGVTIRQHTVQTHNKNPFILRDSNGTEVPATKLWLSDVPISVEGKDLELALKKLGCTMRSGLIFEKSRNKDGNLTRFLTGRRFAFINTPAKPLPKQATLAGFNARLFHREQNTGDPESIVCGRCLNHGHRAWECLNPIRCRECKQEGHKKGDPACAVQWGAGALPAAFDLQRSEQGTFPPLHGAQAAEIEEGEEENERWEDSQSEIREEELLQAVMKSQSTHTSRANDKDKAKGPKLMQTKLIVEPRHRSATPTKRHRQLSGDSPSKAAEREGKRRDSGRDKGLALLCTGTDTDT